MGMWKNRVVVEIWGEMPVEGISIWSYFKYTDTHTQNFDGKLP